MTIPNKVTGTVYMTNKSQAIRLPKAIRFAEDVKHVDIVKIGQKLIITPAGQGWDNWFNGPKVSDDFMNDRCQPEMQERETL